MNPDDLSGRVRTAGPENRTDNTPSLGGVRSGALRRGPLMAATASHAQPSGSFAVSPRLLNLRQMADYLGCSYWSARDWVLAGLVPVVELPPLRPRQGERPRTTLRRVLVDRADLDAFIEARKRGCSPDIQSHAPATEAGNPRRNRASVPGVCPR